MICIDLRDASKRPGALKRDVSCAELVLDVETKTQRVILKKKVVCLHVSFTVFLNKILNRPMC